MTGEIMQKVVIKAGNSLAVVIPSRYVKIMGIKAGDKVQVTVSPTEGKVTYTFVHARQLSLV